MSDKVIYHYTVAKDVSMVDAEQSLQLAILAAACLYGEPAVRLDAAYSMDKDLGIFVVDASTDPGRSICLIFTGFLAREFGDDTFCVRLLGSKQPNTGSQPSASATNRGQRTHVASPVSVADNRDQEQCGTRVASVSEC